MYFCKRGLVLANRGPFLQDFEGGPPATSRWAGGPVRHCKDQFDLTLIHMGFFRATIYWGGGSFHPPSENYLLKTPQNSIQLGTVTDQVMSSL